MAQECGVSAATLNKLDRMDSLRQGTHDTLTRWRRESYGRDTPLKNLRAFTGRRTE